MNRFQVWFQRAYPAITMWRHVRLSMVQAYVDYLQIQGKAPDTIRQALFPVRKASLLWHSDYPRIFDHITTRIRIPKADGASPKSLSPDQLGAVLSFLQEHYPNLYPLIALAGYSGMRLREASGILNRDLDLETGTLNIENNHIRKLKNHQSARLIPLTEKALEILKSHHATAPVKTFLPGDPVFFDLRGALWTKYRLGQDCRNAKKSMMRHVKLPAWFRLNKTRATFHTTAVRAGVRELYAEKYQGRKSQSISQKHYLEIEVEDLRREVVDVYDAIVTQVADSESFIDSTTQATQQR